MGLDLYAGTLTRYYSRNWKTTVQQWAEENGYAFNRIGPDGPMEQEQKPDPAEVRSAIESWRDTVIEALKRGGTDCPSWPESNDAPYYTDKPDWDAWCALLLTAACTVCGEEVPATVEKGWSRGFYDDQADLLRRAGEKAAGSLFAGAEVWLPFPEAFWFGYQNPVGTQVVISTTGGLKKELERFNSLLWQAPEETILSWTTTEGYPPDGEIGPDGKYVQKEVHTAYDTVSLAKMAYSILYRAVRFSEENQAAILLDY